MSPVLSDAQVAQVVSAINTCRTGR
jgi:hypothetical protein